MTKNIRKHLLIFLGWLCVLLGLIGVLLPLLPTTPFMILALSLFAKSSPRFHKMLLENPYIGTDLKQWEESKTISPRSKKKAMLIIIITFAISIAVLHQKPILQVMLLTLCSLLLIYMWRIKEE